MSLVLTGCHVLRSTVINRWLTTSSWTRIVCDGYDHGASDIGDGVLLAEWCFRRGVLLTQASCLLTFQSFYFCAWIVLMLSTTDKRCYTSWGLFLFIQIIPFSFTNNRTQLYSCGWCAYHLERLIFFISTFVWCFSLTFHYNFSLSFSLFRSSPKTRRTKGTNARDFAVTFLLIQISSRSVFLSSDGDN